MKQFTCRATVILIMMMLIQLGVEGAEYSYPEKYKHIICQLLTEYCQVDLASSSFGRQIVASCESSPTVAGKVKFECHFDDPYEPEESSDFVYESVASWAFNQQPPFGLKSIDTSSLIVSGSVFCSFLEYGCYDVKGETVVDFQCTPAADPEEEFVQFAKCELTNEIDLTRFLVEMNLRIE